MEPAGGGADLFIANDLTRIRTLRRRKQKGGTGQSSCLDATGHRRSARFGNAAILKEVCGDEIEMLFC